MANQKNLIAYGEPYDPHNSPCAVIQILSGTILCSLKPSTPNHIVSFLFFTKFEASKLSQDFFACLGPKILDNFDVYFIFLENMYEMEENSFYLRKSNSQKKFT